MLTTALLTAGLAVAQPPAPAPIIIPQPMSQPVRMMPQDKPMAPMGTPPAALAPAAPVAESAAAEPEAPATKYLAERLLEGTRVGQLLDDRGIKVYGWSQMSYNFGSTKNTNAPLQFIDKADNFMFNQNILRMEKPIDTSKDEFQLGFRSDTLLGQDARFSIPRGLFDYQLTKNNRYPFDNIQSYAEAFLPGIGAQGTTLKVGRFYTLINNESFEAISNPFISRSYSFQTNPYTHTGALATTQLSDDFSVSYGASTGCDVFIDPAARLTFIGGFKYAPKGGKSSLAFNTVITNPKYDSKEEFAHYNAYNLIYTHNITDKLTYSLNTVASHMQGFPGTSGAAWWYGVTNYLSYAFTDHLTGNARVELFQDDKGVRTGFQGLFTTVTLGTQWKASDSIIISPEVRYDHCNNSAPFEGKQNLFVGALSLIVRW